MGGVRVDGFIPSSALSLETCAPAEVDEGSRDPAQWPDTDLTGALPALTIATYEIAPARTLGIGPYIALVRDFERRYPDNEQQDTGLMLTRLRKVYYNTQGWDAYLIAGAQHVAAPYSVRLSTQSDTLPIAGVPDATINRTVPVAVDARGNVVSLAAHQEIALTDGTYIDMGHVFAGLDAANHRQVVDGPASVNLDSNVSAATWVGDLGSVLAEWHFAALAANWSLSDAERQAIAMEYAPPRDMLGNVDVYAIARSFYLKGEGLRVSDLLEAYYIDGVGRAERRHSIFAADVGLVGWNGQGWSNEEAWVDATADQVNDAAALYTGSIVQGPAKYSLALGMSVNPQAAVLVRSFLESLRTEVRRERADLPTCR